MDNPISINLGGDNSMSNLSFHWMAEFNDGVIHQFENNNENRFQLVKDKMYKLEYFHLHHIEKDLRFIVDLKKGLIKFNDSAEPKEIEKKENIRLIFFRRHKITMTESGKETNHTIVYHLGFQYNDKFGYNKKIVMQIDNEGNWILGD